MGTAGTTDKKGSPGVNTAVSGPGFVDLVTLAEEADEPGLDLLGEGFLRRGGGMHKEAEEIREHFLKDFHIANILQHSEKALSPPCGGWSADILTSLLCVR